MSHPWGVAHRWSVIGGFILLTSVLFLLLDSQVKLFKEEKPILWSSEEVELLKSLSISSAPILAGNRGNYWADDESAAAFGQQLFFEEKLSLNGNVACSTCHQPDKYFTDGRELPLVNHVEGDRNTPTIVGAALSQWQFWDGRSDSLWSQALGPMENIKEQGNNRLNIVRFIKESYAHEYKSVFEDTLPELPDVEHASPVSSDPQIRQNWKQLSDAEKRNINRVFVNVGKAIAAYERRLLPGVSRFDHFVEAVVAKDMVQQNKWLSREEQRGLKLFISDESGRCTQCHNGPYFTNSDFQAIAVPPVPDKGGDLGRIEGVQRFANNEFHCLSEYSDALIDAGDCDEVLYGKQEGIELVGAFKVPSLRNVSKTAPYMHGGQLKNLREVLHYYNRAPMELGAHSEITPMMLLPRELKMIEAFLRTLDSEIAADPQWLSEPKSDTPYKMSSVFGHYQIH